MWGGEGSPTRLFQHIFRYKERHIIMKSWLWVFVVLYLTLALVGCATKGTPGNYNVEFTPYEGKPYWYLNEVGR